MDPESGQAVISRLGRVGEAERRRVTRLWNFFNKGEEFWPIREWPLWAQNLALKMHLSYQERYELFFFFAVNGLPPVLLEEWVLATDAQLWPARQLFSDGYDRSAQSHVKSMVPQYVEGRMVQQRGARMYDMVLGRPVLHK